MRNGHTGELRYRRYGTGCPTESVSGVDLLSAVAFNFNLGIARDGNHGNFAFSRIYAQKNHHVGTGCCVVDASIGAKHQHIERLAFILYRVGFQHGSPHAVFVFLAFETHS